MIHRNIIMKIEIKMQNNIDPELHILSRKYLSINYSYFYYTVMPNARGYI